MIEARIWFPFRKQKRLRALCVHDEPGLSGPEDTTIETATAVACCKKWHFCDFMVSKWWKGDFDTHVGVVALKTWVRGRDRVMGQTTRSVTS